METYNHPPQTNPHDILPFTLSVMQEERERGALLIAACLIAAIRLRGESIQPSPKLKATIYDSVQLAVMVWREIQGRSVKPVN
jgi:hypothetical protein